MWGGIGIYFDKYQIGLRGGHGKCAKGAIKPD
jgi:hypothetical protein